MGRMKLSEAQMEILAQHQQQQAMLQEQGRVVLTTILAGANIRVAQNVRQEGDYLIWDDNEEGGPDGDEGGAEGNAPTGPELHADEDSEGPEADDPAESGSEEREEATVH